MRKVIAIIHKELDYYFKSPMAYIILFLTIATFNVFFYLIIDHNKEAALDDMFRLMEFLFLFIIPLLSMRVFAEEKSHGTMEFLMTTPTNNTQIILGKYFGVLTFYSAIIATTLIYYFILAIFSSIGFIESMTGYFGLWIEGAMFIALAIFMSSLTKNQIIAGMMAYVGIFFLYFATTFEKFVDGSVQIFLMYMSSLRHAENFAVGMVTLADLVYYISGILIFLILTRVSIEQRIWE